MSAPDLLALARSGRVHFVGIGGAGMCALAELFVRSGGRVSGCDLHPGPTTERLRALDVEILEGHDPDHLSDVSAIVATSAVPGDHPELSRARELGIPVVKRAVALGNLVNHGRVLGIAGTHGKTSTTAMAAEILAAAGLDPTGVVGGTVPAWEGNLRYGRSDLFVVEADEYDRSFHALEPDVAVITNVEPDHLDIFGDLEGVREGFRAFLKRVRPGGKVVACADDVEASRLLTELPGETYTYGLAAGSQLRATELDMRADGTRFRVFEQGRDRGLHRLAIPGVHNLRNALGAAAGAGHFGAGWDAISHAWGEFRGVARRFELLADIDSVVVIDDYAHHPTEIEATLNAAREAFFQRRLIAVFQPHLYTRTRDFAEGFGSSLAIADRVLVTAIYPAREAPIPGVSAEAVVEAVRASALGAVPVSYHPSLDRLPGEIADECREGDVVVLMGAGSIDRTGPELVRRLEGVKVG